MTTLQKAIQGLEKRKFVVFGLQEGQDLMAGEKGWERVGNGRGNCISLGSMMLTSELRESTSSFWLTVGEDLGGKRDGTW